jgi:ribosomal-protein-serine acetyltransferase
MELPLEPLTTANLELHPFRRRDVDPLTVAVRLSLPELTKWLPWAHPGYSRDDAVRFVRESAQAWREGRAYDFAITRTGQSTHLGNVSIWHVSRSFHVGEIGYWVRTDRSGQGIATEVTARMLQVGFDRLGMHRIVLRIAVGNRASERVAEKLDFVREGVLREELKVRGHWLDHTVWSMLEHEYRRRAAAYAVHTGL